MPDNAVFSCDDVACVVSCAEGYGDRNARTTYDCVDGAWTKSDAVDLTCPRKDTVCERHDRDRDRDRI